METNYDRRFKRPLPYWSGRSRTLQKDFKYYIQIVRDMGKGIAMAIKGEGK